METNVLALAERATGCPVDARDVAAYYQGGWSTLAAWARSHLARYPNPRDAESWLHDMIVDREVVFTKEKGLVHIFFT